MRPFRAHMDTPDIDSPGARRLCFALKVNLSGFQLGSRMGVRLWVENSFAPGVGLQSFFFSFHFPPQFFHDVFWVFSDLSDDEVDDGI